MRCINGEKYVDQDKEKFVLRTCEDLNSEVSSLLKCKGQQVILIMGQKKVKEIQRRRERSKYLSHMDYETKFPAIQQSLEVLWHQSHKWKYVSQSSENMVAQQSILSNSQEKASGKETLPRPRPRRDKERHFN